MALSVVRGAPVGARSVDRARGVVWRQMRSEEELEAAIERGAQELSPPQADDRDPSEHHALLLGYYRYGPCANVDQVVLHLTALIRLQPACTRLSLGWVSRESHPRHHAQVANTWRSVVEKSSCSAALLNAFRFFEIADEDYAGRLLKRGLAASPSDDAWHSAAGSYYLRRGLSNANRTQLLLAYAHYAEAQSLTQDGRDSALGLVAYSALKAGRPDEARGAAAEAVAWGGCRESVNRHLGYTVLGMLACEHGDLEQAARHLLASAEHVPSSYLIACGPRLDLAQRLLAAGNRAPVEAFVAHLVAVWPCGAARLKAVLDPS